ncbi:MAG: ATP-binding cassette domain-containing protein [Spirochaetales bacterium]|nr:ATP-binding cassette domain-containing protein [Spirochaetales bacterium]
MSTELYRIENLIFRYDRKYDRKRSQPSDTVLSIPDLTILKDRVTVIRGHNGSGKSTLLKLLNRLLQPTEGNITPGGDFRSVLVHQEPYLFHGSVLHNLPAPLHFQGGRKPGEAEKAASALKMVGLEDFEKRRARELSGGEKKRVAIARALMTGPDVLLLDEPDANVDSRTSRDLEILVQDLKMRGISTVLCSHNRGFAYRCCDDLIDLYQGSPVDHDENVFKGSYRCASGLYAEFRIGEWNIRCPSVTGEYTTAVISPESFTLLSCQPDSDEGNTFEAEIQDIRASKKGLKTLVLAGPADLRMRISDAELSVSNLKKGDRLSLLFSPSSVKLY